MALYQTPPGDGFEPIIRELKDIRRELRDLQRPSGTNIGNTAAQVQMQVAALADLVGQQIRPDYNFANGSGYALPAGKANRIVRASFVFVVPAGFTQALISATAQDTATNTTGGFDYIVSYLQIGVRYAYSASATVPAGHVGDSLATMTNLVTGLVGGDTVTVSNAPYTATASWAAATNNSTILSATCLYLR